MRRWGLLLAALALAAPAPAQEADVAPTLVAKPAPAVPALPPPDSNVAPFYARHPGTLVWLRDADSRAGAAAKLVELLKHSAIDGFADGPALAERSRPAIARGLPADDADHLQRLGALRPGAQAAGRRSQLRRSGAGAEGARPRRHPGAASARRRSPRMSTASPASIRSMPRCATDAIAPGQQDDPHVRATLDRLRLVPRKAGRCWSTSPTRS